jgi:hypothetical protein
MPHFLGKMFGMIRGLTTITVLSEDRDRLAAVRLRVRLKLAELELKPVTRISKARKKTLQEKQRQLDLQIEACDNVPSQQFL